MGTPFLSEIKIVAFNFAPQGWAACNGQLLPIAQNQALFALLGTMYGGNGQTTFALPDFRGRAPVHVGAGFEQGQAGGQEFHTVTSSEMPAHTHQVTASGDTATVASPANAYWAKTVVGAYDAAPAVAMRASSVTSTGGSQPHENRMPFTVLNFMIAITGAFPSHN